MRDPAMSEHGRGRGCGRASTSPRAPAARRDATGAGHYPAGDPPALAGPRPGPRRVVPAAPHPAPGPAALPVPSQPPDRLLHGYRGAQSGPGSARPPGRVWVPSAMGRRHLTPRPTGRNRGSPEEISPWRGIVGFGYGEHPGVRPKPEISKKAATDDGYFPPRDAVGCANYGRAPDAPGRGAMRSRLAGVDHRPPPRPDLITLAIVGAGWVRAGGFW